MFVLVTCVDTVTGTVEVLVATPPTKEVQKLEAALPSSLSWTLASWTAGLPAGIAWEELASSRRAAVALNMVAVVGQIPRERGDSRRVRTGVGNSKVPSKQRDCER